MVNCSLDNLEIIFIVYYKRPLGEMCDRKNWKCLVLMSLMAYCLCKRYYVVCSGLTSLSTIFQSYISMVSGCDRELNVHFYSVASLKYHAQDTWHDTTLSRIILTLGRPVLALPRKSERQARCSCSNFFTTLVCRGIEPVTARSPKQTLYQLSFRGR